MAGIYSLLRKTVKRSANVVRKVGRATTKTVRRGTNALGLTKRRKSRKASRRGGRRH
jgi:hypothetical protein